MPTPPIYAKGVYKAAAPYSIPADVSFTNVAIRSFKEVRSEGIDVLKTFYLDKGLTKEKYTQDELSAASIITLFADDRAAIRLPSTYITEYPLTVSTGYSRLVIGIDIGVFPDSFDLNYLLVELQETVQSVTGLVSQAKLNYAPFSGVLTSEQMESFEANRKAALEGRQTYFSKIQLLEKENARKDLVIAKYEQMLGIAP